MGEQEQAIGEEDIVGVALVTGSSNADGFRSQLRAYVAQQTSFWRRQAESDRALLNSAHASGILEAAKALTAMADEIEFSHTPFGVGSDWAKDKLLAAAYRIKSLARQHPQPTAGQELEKCRTRYSELFVSEQRALRDWDKAEAELVDLRATVARLQDSYQQWAKKWEADQIKIADLERELAAAKAERFDIGTILQWTDQYLGINPAQKPAIPKQLRDIASERAAGKGGNDENGE